MSSAPPSTDQEARIQRHLAFLDTLIAHGMDLENRVHQQATTPTELVSALAAPGNAIPFISPEVIASFAQINQTVRRAILVSRKLAETIPSIRLSPGSIHNPIVRETVPIQRGGDHTRAETLRTPSAERLLSPDIEDRIGNRPIPEIIAGLCRDLGMVTPENLNLQNPDDVEAVPSRATQPVGAGATRPVGAGATQPVGESAAAASPAQPPEKPHEFPNHDAQSVELSLQRPPPLTKPEPRPPKR